MNVRQEMTKGVFGTELEIEVANVRKQGNYGRENRRD